MCLILPQDDSFKPKHVGQFHIVHPVQCELIYKLYQHMHNSVNYVFY